MDKMNALTPGHAWRDHFRRSLAVPLHAPVRDCWENNELADSLRQFQLGESSEGAHLLHFARQFGTRYEDPWLGEAMALFIEEENRHASWLGEFLRAQGEPLLGRHWLDAVFRWVRKPLGFGLMVSVLVAAEIIAVPYYSAVRKATGSRWLQAICSRLLRDEAQHLRFQASNLARVWREWRLFGVLRWLHATFLLLTCIAVWWDHGKVLRKGGYPFWRFLGVSLAILDDVHAEAEDLARRFPAKIRTIPAASIAQVPGSGTSSSPL